MIVPSDLRSMVVVTRSDLNKAEELIHNTIDEAQHEGDLDEPVARALHNVVGFAFLTVEEPREL